MCHGIVRVLVGWQPWEERATAGVPWRFGVLVGWQHVAGASVTGREGGGGCGRAVAFLEARLPRGDGVGERQWAGTAPKWRACRGIFGRPHGGVVGAFLGRRRCRGRNRRALAGLRRSSSLGGRDRQREVGVHAGLSSGVDDKEWEEESAGMNAMEEKEHSN